MAFRGALFRAIEKRSDISSPQGTCANAFRDPVETFYFVSYVIFFVLSLLVIGAQVYVRKRYNNQTTRKLLGPIYAAAISCVAIGWLFQIIVTLLMECATNPARYNEGFARILMGILIAFSIFFRLGSYLLLLAAIWGVTSVISDRLGRDGREGSHKTTTFVIASIVGALALVVIIVESVYYFILLTPKLWASISFFNPSFQTLLILFAACWLLCILISLGSTVHSLRTLKSMFGVAIKQPMIWTFVLYFSLGFTAIVDMIPIAKAVQHNEEGVQAGQQALYFLASLSQTLSFVAVALFAIKCPWDGARGGEVEGAYIPMGDLGYKLDNRRAPTPEQ